MFQEPLGMGSISMDCLPDDLLVQILSLLPTKQAVRTSILSKRWRTLFAFTHNLDFDEPMFWLRGSMRKSFSDFADSSLAFQGGRHIKKLALKITLTTEDAPEVDRWICDALEHGVSELRLRITPTVWYFAFPSKVFTSATLVNMSLGTRQHITNLPSDTSFPALKILFLDSIWFDGDQLADLFLAACPALEDLTINYTLYPNYSFVISGKTIMKLSVTYDCNDYYHYNDRSRMISLETPSVVDLYYSDYPWCEFPRCQLDSLAKATLDLRFFKDNKRQQQNDADVTNLISGIRNVKTLHLTSSAVEVISVYCKGGLPVFNNLTDLVFSSNKQGFRVFLPLLLERSPNLKTLVLSGLHCYKIKRRHRFVRIQIPVNNQIKMLRIMKYQGSENELKHISHFLLKMECLEVLKVYVSPTMDHDTKKMQLTKDMLKLPTASSNLKIQVM